MKRLALLIAVVALSLNVFGQDKGEVYLLTSVSGSFGQQKSNTYNYNGTVASTTESPWDTKLGFNAGVGWFAAKNFRLELALGVSNEKQPREQTSSSSWLYSNFLDFSVNPSLSYYVRLADRFYYAPEIGVGLAFGKFTYEDMPSHAWNYPYRCYNFYANLLAFEYRVGPHFGLWVNVGNLNHYRWSYYDDGKIFYSSRSTGFNLNYGIIAAHIYF